MRTLFRIYTLFLFLSFSFGVAAQTRIYYVSTTEKGNQDGSSWDNAMTLVSALNMAKSGDQIWVQGFEEITGNNIYTAPKEGFMVKSGVQLYGGFSGKETNVNDREDLGKQYQLKYKSVLVGDIEKNDTVDNINLIFPANGTRTDNGIHVLSVNMSPQSGGNSNTWPTVINGFSIGNGQASGQGADGYGGGIYVHGDNTDGGIFRIERCFLLNNYATQGGAIYVAKEVKDRNNNTSIINQCVVYNNAAGDRSSVINAGGGIWLDGQATVANTSVFNNENGGLRLSSDSKVVNSTIVRNTGAGVDMTTQENKEANVYNSIIWGNTLLSAEYQPVFMNSAYHEVVPEEGKDTDANGNVYVAKENLGTESAPMFDAPSLKISYDRDFNWRLSSYPLWSWNILEGSVMIDRGNGAYDNTAYGNYDMAGNDRRSGSAIDIGAYEFQYLSPSRIRYVKEGGSGDGSSWANASGDLQKMIDELADNNPQEQSGEVWVAAGTYQPIGWLDPSKSYTAAFRMRDGISVYGGFAGDESSKTERKMSGVKPWQYENVTILKGASYSNDAEWNSTDNKWTVNSSASRHVVWFAPYPYAENTYFSSITILDGVTVIGGNAQGITGVSDFRTDCGGGVFMERNSYLQNCIVKECSAAANGGAVYISGGRMTGSLVYNSSADADGGGVFVDNAGIVLQSMVTNCSATNGGGVYLDRNGLWDGQERPEYLIVSTSIITNNTNKANGALYCDEGGVVLQTIVARNNTLQAPDLANSNSAQTGGLYINKYGLIINSVLWGNDLMGSITAQTYIKNPNAESVRFYNVGVSNFNSTIWNDTRQVDILPLADNNDTGGTDAEGYISPNFTEGLPSVDEVGVNPQLESVDYFWEPITGSNLRARGLELGQIPAEVLISPELDINTNTFQQKPSIGAYSIEATKIIPEVTDEGKTLRVYVDADCTVPGHNGASWESGYRSLNDALAYYAAIPAGPQTINGQEVNVSEDTRFEIYVLEGDLWPRYAFTNLDSKTATISITAAASGATYYIYGGYRRESDNSAERNPLAYRSIINGNHIGNKIEEGLYHCITVLQQAKVVIDGFHVINGYAAGEASRQYGAGLLVHSGADVTVRNCIFENNTAEESAAIDARNATLTMENCVVNNNTNIDETKPVVNAGTLTMKHVTVVNNLGAAPDNMGESSFSVGNTKETNTVSFASFGADGAKNFANPTNGRGATLGFDTYLGGYSEFRPLTGSVESAEIINKSRDLAVVAELPTDINGKARDLGGLPDKGAYEAVLPESGKVIYVRTDGSENGNGLAWDTALNSLTAALDMASEYPEDSKPKIWVAAGTYTSVPGNINDNMLHGQPYAYKMVEGVNVFGGFPSDGCPGEEDRNPKMYETILQPKDAPTEFPASKSNGSITLGRVLVQEKAFASETVWDGFTIRNGYLNTHYRYFIQGDFLNCPTTDFITVAGAGALLLANGVLENCKIENNRILSWNLGRYGEGGGSHGAGGGVYCYGGTIKNCQIINNHLRVYSAQDSYNGYDYNGKTNAGTGSAFAYGGGLYMQSSDNKISSVYNTVISGNTLEALAWSGTAKYHTIAIGAGVCQVSGNFYNNTIVGNTSITSNAERSNVMCGGVLVYTDALLYNCIIYNNKGEGGRAENPAYPQSMTYKKNEQIVCLKLNDALKEGTDYESGGKPADNKQNLGYVNNSPGIKIYYSNVGRLNDGQPEKSTFLEYTEGNNSVTYESRNNTYLYPEFVDEGNRDYHLDTNSPAINSGTETIPDVTIPDNDAEYTDRVKDCGIDMGAFESTNDGNVAYNEITAEDGSKRYVYYVNQNGLGSRSGQSPDNAACAMKLQQILAHAGQTVGQVTDGNVYVFIAGYNQSENAFVYHANTLSDPNDPQSYTYVVPAGVTVEGGYSEDFSMRDPYTLRTRLSAVKESTTTMQEVNGYHVITFGGGNGMARLSKPAIIDGLWLEGGKATSLAGAGNPKTMGGGAIVPAGAHVRNCAVTGCEAVNGGALYLMPGSLVSGSLIQGNTAGEGGGIFADSIGVSADKRAHIISCTVSGNMANDAGGGIYQMDGAVMVLNTVIWGNSAPADRNVSGVVSSKFADNSLLEMVKTTDHDYTDNTYYPYNYCFVETFEMSTTFENTQMTSEEDIYFETGTRQLKAYSPMIKRGMLSEYIRYWEDSHKISTSDMRQVARLQADYSRADAGAFAYVGGPLQIDELITRIFVSKGTKVQLKRGEEMTDYLGRSFYTSLNHLDDALEYIKRVRNNHTEGADDNTVFEILLGPGVYKPSIRRQDAASTTYDQRQNSFVLPTNVRIYGGFSGNEYISSDSITLIPAISGDIKVDHDGDLHAILDSRAFSDLNANNIYEPWELANHSILSGELDVSNESHHVYHVVYSSASSSNRTENGQVILDGITVMRGETANSISEAADVNEIGRGGGIYTNGIDYILHRCRIMDNKAVRGGGIYMRNASATLIGCVVAGNGSVEGYSGADEMRGGGIYVSGYAAPDGNGSSVYAVNTLFANNETSGCGGALALGSLNSSLDMVNCNVVRNKAKRHGAIYSVNESGGQSSSSITNTVIWGNEDNDAMHEVINNPSAKITYSASEWLATDNESHNIRLNAENMATDGPRFKTPSVNAGVAYNSSSSMWNPASISVLADNGDGTYNTETNTESGVYAEWFGKYAEDFKGQYMKERERYMAPLDEDGQTPDEKVIDIGLFEYPHPADMSRLDAVYVATSDAGLADGTSWANATSNLKQAIIAMANPSGGFSKQKKIYVRDGEYSMGRLSQDNVAFPLYMNDSYDFGESLEIVGACTGIAHAQDFSKPTILTNSPLVQNSTNILLDISTGTKPVTISGFTFANTSQGDATAATTVGKGVNIMSIGNGGIVTLKNVSFRNNFGYGVHTVENNGKLLLVNALFADGAFTEGSTGVGLYVSKSAANTTVVNATFAQNRKDISKEEGSDGDPSVYNSVSWANGEQAMKYDNNNVVFKSGIINADIQNGPNFVDPSDEDVMARDYSIRPNMLLLNKGSNLYYTKEAFGEEIVDIPDTETDLGNNVRQTGDAVDVGAYEYSGVLQQIIYVKPVVGGTGDGSSWPNATNDLQGAVDLASVYSANNEGQKGYVFVHNNQPMNTALRVSMPGAMIYGGMNDETSEGGETAEIVANLLAKRNGLLQANRRSVLSSGVNISAASVVDGFEIIGNSTVSNGGTLSTSIIKGDVDSDTGNNGLLYNSLVQGDVSGVRAVNVTATGTIDGVTTDSGNNRASAGENTYVTDDYWKYQLMETSTDIDPETDRIDINPCMELVGHERDLIGNKRIRNNVDNGCFETWNIATDGQQITAGDYPIGKSVVYVRKDKELLIDAGVYSDGNAFNPGYLLLEHHAGLRGNRNYIRLTNFAVERIIPGQTADFVTMPFDVNTAASNLAGLSPKRYDGSLRAAYSYKFDNSDGAAWTDLNIDQASMYEGLLFENTTGEEKKLRFSGKSTQPYTEVGADKSISLVKYNFNEPWTSASAGGNKFTHKENMSWNLFGSPYLCAMNYSDMEYGRVIYGYNSNGYHTISTADAARGYIPAGDAVFTQTATLKDAETVVIGRSAERDGDAYEAGADLSVSLVRTGAARAADERTADVLQLNTVPAAESRNYFDIASDGVKWMADSVAQIYAALDGGRYSLLSAVSDGGEVTVGVTLPEPGMYTFYIPETCDACSYESVVLKDTKTGEQTNLLDGGYDFTSVEGGDISGRFTISFNCMLDDDRNANIRAWSPSRDRVSVSGVEAGDRIAVYTADGVQAASCVASSSVENIQASVSGVAVVEITRDGRTIAVRKVKMK